MLNDGAADEGVQAVVRGSVLWQVRLMVKSERFPLALEQLDDVRGENIKFIIFQVNYLGPGGGGASARDGIGKVGDCDVDPFLGGWLGRLIKQVDFLCCLPDKLGPVYRADGCCRVGGQCGEG